MSREITRTDGVDRNQFMSCQTTAHFYFVHATTGVGMELTASCPSSQCHAALQENAANAYVDPHVPLATCCGRNGPEQIRRSKRTADHEVNAALSIHTRTRLAVMMGERTAITPHVRARGCCKYCCDGRQRRRGRARVRHRWRGCSE